MAASKTLLLFSTGMQQASINLTQSLHEVYEPDWHGKDNVLSIGKVSPRGRNLNELTDIHTKMETVML